MWTWKEWIRKGRNENVIDKTEKERKNLMALLGLQKWLNWLAIWIYGCLKLPMMMIFVLTREKL
jgi:hypothetical protein